MDNIMDTTKPATTIKCWVHLYSDNLYSWAFHKTSSREVAEDLVQETFLAAFQALPRFKGDSNPKTWLFAILNNKINDHYRRCYRNPVLDDDGVFDKIFDENGEWRKEERPGEWLDEECNVLDDANFRQVLQDCLHRLPGKWLAAVHLKFMEEKNGEQICKELGITNTNFWQVLHRAKLQLRKCLEVNWFKN